MVTAANLQSAWRERFEKLAKHVPKRPDELIADRTARRLRALAKFRDRWPEDELGPIEHALAAMAFDAKMQFDPKLPHASDLLLARLVFTQARGVASEWGKTLHLVRTGKLTVDGACDLGVRKTAEKTRKRGSKTKPRPKKVRGGAKKSSARA